MLHSKRDLVAGKHFAIPLTAAVQSDSIRANQSTMWRVACANSAIQPMIELHLKIVTSVLNAFSMRDINSKKKCSIRGACNRRQSGSDPGKCSMVSSVSDSAQKA